ncbi:MAG: histidine kinase [Ferruginibacter sp.]
MQQSKFIFSDEPSYRIKRHLIFWLVWWIFQGFLYSFIAINSGTEYFARLRVSLMESLIFLSDHIFLSYALMYFVIPRFLLKQRYWLTALWVIISFFIAASISAILSFTAIPAVRDAMMGDAYVGPPRTPTVNLFLALLAGFRGALTVGGIAAAIKLMKYWYVKEQRNLQLLKENVEAQLQLLKAQVHPHFLFNTLNNIFSYTQNTSPTAARLVMGLSDMLRYMLYEGNQPLVPLHKEIKLLKDYCSLEQVRYDNRLQLQIDLPVDDQDLYIAPLLLLPFVENCFKHGASNLVEEAWISLSIGIEDNRMKMKLVNSKPIEERTALHKKTGIGMANVQERLNLLYAGKYELVITNEAEIFIVNLTIELEKQVQVANNRVPPKIVAVHAKQ